MNTVNDRIKELREYLGLSQLEMADRLLIPRVHLDNIEKGVYLPEGTLARMICREYDVEEDWLFYGQGNRFHQEPEENEPVVKGCRATAEDLETFQSTPVLTGLFDACEERCDHDRDRATKTGQDALNEFLEELKGRHMTEQAMISLSDRIYDLTNQEYEAGYRYGMRDMVQLLLEAIHIGGGAGPEEKLRLLAEKAEQKGRPA